VKRLVGKVAVAAICVLTTTGLGAGLGAALFGLWSEPGPVLFKVFATSVILLVPTIFVRLLTL
jgi:hypothetical protein